MPGQPGAFELKVSGGRVWANNQYDRRVLVVDADGHDHYADKGPGRDLGDTEGGSGPPGGAGTPPEGDQEPGIEGPTDGQPGQPSNATVAVPKFPRGTQYREACAALKALNLICRPVAAGDEAGLRTGDVRGTDPAGGRMVPVHSRVVVRYVGPVRTPAVLGVPHSDACRQIQAAKLKCAERADPAPALAPDQLTRVSTQDPAPRAPLDKGDTVTITYPDSIALPSFADQSWAEACNLIDGAYMMRCQAVAGDPPAAGKQPGQAYAQDPVAGTVVKVGSTVRLRYYRGESTPGNLVGSSVSAACAELASLGLGCTPVEGSCAWNTGHAVREVAQQRPPGRHRDAGGHGGERGLLHRPVRRAGLRGGNAQAACADIGARGFVCNAVAELHPSTNVVFAQDQAAGRYPLGTAITIHYSRWAMVDWWIVQFGAGWRMVVGSGTYRLGYGYAANEDIPGGRGLNEFICAAGGTRCNGYASNVFYSQVGSVRNQNFSMQPFAVFMACTGAAGQRPMWRVWNAGMPRGYGMTGQDPGPVGSPSHNPPGGDHELLGCVW